jgi:hypothetical protein
MKVGPGQTDETDNFLLPYLAAIKDIFVRTLPGKQKRVGPSTVFNLSKQTNRKHHKVKERKEKHYRLKSH